MLHQQSGHVDTDLPYVYHLIQSNASHDQRVSRCCRKPQPAKKASALGVGPAVTHRGNTADAPCTAHLSMFHVHAGPLAVHPQGCMLPLLRSSRNYILPKATRCCCAGVTVSRRASLFTLHTVVSTRCRHRPQPLHSAAGPSQCAWMYSGRATI